MVKRFNGQISDVLRTNRFDRTLDLKRTLMRYVDLDNTQLPQSALESLTRMQGMKDWNKFPAPRRKNAPQSSGLRHIPPL